MTIRSDGSTEDATTASPVLPPSPTPPAAPRRGEQTWLTVSPAGAPADEVAPWDLADRVAVLDDGRVVAEGTPAELKRLVPGGHVRLQLADGDQLEAVARAFPRSVADEVDLSV